MRFASTFWFQPLMALLSGTILIFAYPPWNFEGAVWFWMLPLLTVLWPLPPRQPPRRPFLLGLTTGLAFFIPNVWWIRHSARVINGALDHRWIGLGPELLGLAAVIGLAIYCAVWFGVWAWFAARVAKPELARQSVGAWQESTWLSLRGSFLAAGAWTACEWCRGSIVFGGFGWNGLGAGLHQNFLLMQCADLVGVLGLSFLPVFAVCTGYNTFARLLMVSGGHGTSKARMDFVIAMLIVLAAAGYGFQKTATPEGETVTVRTVLVQPNVPQVVRWSGEDTVGLYRQLSELTRLHAEARNGPSGVDLVIWPESAIPINLFDVYQQLPPGEHALYLNDLLASGDFSLLTGCDVLVPRDEPHTSVALMRGSVGENFSRLQFYHKINLVAFGEYLPYRDIPPFAWLKGVLPSDYRPGTATEPLVLAQPRNVQIIPLICFEDTFGQLARKFVRPEPQMIVNVTNDGWFLQSLEPEIHLLNAKFRAVELRRPMCRATNTGITCFIDTKGRETRRLVNAETGNTSIPGCLQGDVAVPLHPETTLYAKYGEWFPLSLLALSAIALLQTTLSKRRSREKSRPDGNLAWQQNPASPDAAITRRQPSDPNQTDSD